MKKSNKIDFKKASEDIIYKIAYVYNAKVDDIWINDSLGAIITFKYPFFTSDIDICNEASLGIIIAKNLGLINDGAVEIENRKAIVKLF